MGDKFDGYGVNNQTNEKDDKKETKSTDPFDIYLKFSQLPQEELAEKKPSIGDTALKDAVKNDEKEQESLDDLLTTLDDLVGLNRVKSEIRGLLQFVRIQELRREKKISIVKPSLHCIFYGSPGTGKTTIARLYGQILARMGLLSKGHLVETDRSGLVGGYIGQTAIKTDEKIKEALGGILFIDEAYSLSKGDDTKWDYGEEAIAILLKRMEDFRDDFVVIAAGYPEPMEHFLASNEGLRSRFSTYIHFDDYSPQDMDIIFKKLCDKENYAPTEEALEFVFSTIDYNYSIRDKSFGNARYVRNLFEIIIKNQAYRLGTTNQNPTTEELRLLLPIDVPFLTPSGTTSFNPSFSKQKGEK